MVSNSDSICSLYSRMIYITWRPYLRIRPAVTLWLFSQKVHIHLILIESIPVLYCPRASLAPPMRPVHRFLFIEDLLKLGHQKIIQIITFFSPCTSCRYSIVWCSQQLPVQEGSDPCLLSLYSRSSLFDCLVMPFFPYKKSYIYTI